ncbi:NAD(P)H-hydrate epimerase [Microbacterium gorillae]|uniref:NAD(P)H-hydrate epimerase n=1 Tax=Microbacterium gorillae TaxID=1231063 RepID=UPI00058E3810|nr:NAD(P)H-hydrate epimerase [Microbacterium gorillae]
MNPLPLLTAEAVRDAEAPLLRAGVPLMARAAGALADVVREAASHRAGAVLVLAGAGDNGGDALYAAAQLERALLILRTADRVHEDALAAALAVGAEVVTPSDPRLDSVAVVLDGILGTGVRHPRLRPAAAAVVEAGAARARAGALMVAVDLPSGLDPDDGTVASAVLRADLTVTFGAVKCGLTRGRGPEVTGELLLADIGLEIPESAAVGWTEAVARCVDARSREYPRLAGG